MTPTDPPPPRRSGDPDREQAAAGQAPPPSRKPEGARPERNTAAANTSGAVRRPATGGGAVYRHPIEAPEFGQPHDEFHPDSRIPVHPHGTDDELHNADVAHEHSDVNIRALVSSAIVLVIVTIAAHVIIYFLFGWMEKDAAASQAAVSPLARPATDMPKNTLGSPTFNATAGVAGPQLLTNEPMALQKQRADEAQRLQGYGWVNEQTGVAHMPIEQAKKLIVERGLPVRPEAAVAPTLGTSLPAAGEASGGRVITAPPPAEAPAEPAKEQPAAKPHGGH